MLDVHPPHRPTHTWKDFFIHIATIVVGLIIAVGLEQTVEFFHHRHQLQELIESLNSDTRVLEQDARLLAGNDKATMAWLRETERRVNDAIWTCKPMGELPARPVLPPGILLSYTHFQAGKASGLLQLLSTEDLDAYSDANFDVELTVNADQRVPERSAALASFTASFMDREFKQPDLSKSSLAELREFLRLLAALELATRTRRQHADEAAGAAAAILRGERGIRRLQAAEIDELNRDFAPLPAPAPPAPAPTSAPTPARPTR